MGNYRLFEEIGKPKQVSFVVFENYMVKKSQNQSVVSANFSQIKYLWQMNDMFFHRLECEENWDLF